MKAIKRTFFILSLFLACHGCTSARWAAMTAINKSHHIKQFSGGKLVGEWDSVGIVNSEPKSDGYFFEDRETGLLVTVSGTVQITINKY